MELALDFQAKRKKVNLECDEVAERGVTTTRQQEMWESFDWSSTGHSADRQWEAEPSRMLAARQDLLVRASPAPLTAGK